MLFLSHNLTARDKFEVIVADSIDAEPRQNPLIEIHDVIFTFDNMVKKTQRLYKKIT